MTTCRLNHAAPTKGVEKATKWLLTDVTLKSASRFMKTKLRRNGDIGPVLENLLDRPQRTQGNLTLQLVTSFIDAFHQNKIPTGVRMPSSRSLAKSLGMARNTVISAYTMLSEQGFIVSKYRSGTFVAEKSNVLRKTDSASLANPFNWHQRMNINPNIEQMDPHAKEDVITHDFKYGQFDLSLFPTNHWRECERSASGVKEIAEWGRDAFDLDDEILVESLRCHVLPTYGIWAEADEILVTLGGQEGRYLVTQLLCDEGTLVGIENPGMPDTNDIVSKTRAKRIYLPMDASGACLSSELEQCDIAILTPGHQCPTTAVMPEDRRLSLLELARAKEIIIVEDTYQTETVCQAKMAPALKSLDRDGRVVHIGSFSKLVAPGLRLGYVVAPKVVIQQLRQLRRLIHRHPPGNTQRAIGMFIDRGYYHSYLRKVAAELAVRNDIMERSIRRWMPYVSFMHCSGGSTFWLSFPENIDLAEIALAAKTHGIRIDPGHRFFFANHKRNHLLMAVSQIAPENIEPGVKKMSQLIFDASAAQSVKANAG